MEIGNTVADISRDILAFTIKCLTPLAIYKNNLMLRASYGGVDFPRQVASASLKPLLGTIYRTDPRDFPRQVASASLKLYSYSYEYSYVQEFSEAGCLGLIEAIS